MGEYTREVLDTLADGPVVAVSHVSPIKAAVLWALGLPDLYAWRLRLDNASVTRLAPGPDGPVLLSFNER
jgi:broad specificity phosphatase PhoE